MLFVNFTNHSYSISFSCPPPFKTKYEVIYAQFYPKIVQFWWFWSNSVFFIFYALILCWPVKTCFSKRTTNLSEKFKNVNKIWTEIKRHQTSWRNFCLQKDPEKKLNSEHKKINHGILCYWCCWPHRLVFMKIIKMHGKVFSHSSHKMTYNLFVTSKNEFSNSRI